MANIKVKDADALVKYLKATGAGTDGDPYIPQHLETNSASALTALQAIKTAVELLDNVVDGTEMQVDIVSSTLPAGAATETTLSAVKVAVESLETTVSGTELQVDVQSSALPTGAATSANQSTIIGHVDGLETLLTSLETLLTAIDTDTSSMNTDLGTLAGAVTGSEMQVDVVTSSLPLGASTESTLNSVKTAVELIDDAVATISATDLLRVAIFDSSDSQITSFGGGTQYTEGDTDATIVGTALMWEDSADTLRAISSTYPLPVDITDSTIAVTQSGNWDINDISAGTQTNDVKVTLDSESVAVTMSTLPDTAGGDLADIETNTDFGTITGGGVEANTLRVTLANDSTGLISVDDNDDSLTIDNADLTTLAGAVSGGQMQVDVVGALPAGDNNIGNVDIVSSVALDVSAETVTVDSTNLDIRDLTNASDSILVYGSDDSGTTKRVIKTDSTGAVQVDIESSATVPISNADLSTIAGAVTGSEMQVDIVSDGAGLATSANQSTIIGHLDGVEGSLTDIETNTDYGAVVGGGAEATALRVTLANDSTGLISVDDNGNSLTIDNADISTIAGAVTGSEMQVDVVAALPAGTNTIGSTYLVPQTSGGCSIFRSIDVDETEEEVKATAGQIYSMYLYNSATEARFIKFYNATAATVVVGTTTPVITVELAASQGLTLNEPNGIAFGTAICIAATTAVGDSDTGAPGANEVLANVFYK